MVCVSVLVIISANVVGDEMTTQKNTHANTHTHKETVS